MSLTRAQHPFEFTPRPQPEPEVKQAILASWATRSSMWNGSPNRGQGSGSKPNA